MVFSGTSALPSFPLFFFPRWKNFKRHMLNMRSHSDSKGFELKRPNDSIYTFPCPDCMCFTNKSNDTKSSLAPWFSEWETWWLYTLENVILPTQIAANPPFSFVILSFFPFRHSERAHLIWDLQGFVVGGHIDLDLSGKGKKNKKTKK